jgi:hypothetical protein
MTLTHMRSGPRSAYRRRKNGNSRLDQTMVEDIPGGTIGYRGLRTLAIQLHNELLTRGASLTERHPRQLP